MKKGKNFEKWFSQYYIFLSIPLNSAIAARTQKLQVNLMNQRDERMRLTSEVLNGIKVTKETLHREMGIIFNSRIH